MTNIEQLTEWTNKSLLANRYQLLGSLEEVQMTAWSSVRRILTTKGYVYLKKTPNLLSLEPVIIQMLHNKFHVNVPIVIDINSDLNCFLMSDAGKPFYFFKDNELRLRLIREAISKYKHIQNQSISLVNTFIDMGVPDWRLEHLPKLYNQLIMQEKLLIEDGMSIDDIKILSNLSAKCEALCEQLSKSLIPETLDHCDMHGGNVLIDEKTNAIIIIDWGETVITHPFLSLTVFLRGLVRYYSFNESELWDSCFENENKIERKDLEKIVLLAKRLEPIYSALTFHRLLISSDKEKFMSTPNCKGRITKYLQEFINDQMGDDFESNF